MLLDFLLTSFLAQTDDVVLRLDGVEFRENEEEEEEDDDLILKRRRGRSCGFYHVGTK